MKPRRDAERLIRKDVINMEPYTSIAPLEVLSERIRVSVEEIIKLDGNENPYGCSPQVQCALSNYPYYHIYPDSEQRQLRKALEGYVGAPADYIVVGSGSDELIDLILRLFIEPGDEVINCVPTFGMYPFSTETCGGKVVDVPRDKNFAVDIAGVKKAIHERTKVIFLASPNNPTGNTVLQRDVLKLVETGIVVVIDEAYYEFCGETLVPLVAQYDNLSVLRTFSKWAGIAGLRVGYGVFPPKITEHLMKIKPPYNVNVAAQIAAVETLKDLDYRQKTIKAILEEREHLFNKLAKVKS
ncbi:MAG TPA: histidinol-phosphate transaminase, partial [Dehalococcoidia bacterium]|nr:histidinol-phosphate transaminase [Dehalococcoidia bacterium]